MPHPLAAALALLLLALLPAGRAQADSGWQTGKLGQLGFGTVSEQRAVASAACCPTKQQAALACFSSAVAL